MALLLVILIPLAALVIYAVVSDLRRRRRRAPQESRHQLGGAHGPCGRGRPWRHQPRAAARRRRAWRRDWPRPLTILMSHGQGAVGV